MIRLETGQFTTVMAASGSVTRTAPNVLRPGVRGKFLYLGHEKLWIRGVTYGAFPPNQDGHEYHDLDVIERDTLDVDLLRATLRGQSERVGRELRAEGYAGRTVTLKLRFADFSTITRAHTDDPTQDGLAIYRQASASLGRVRLGQPVRLIGLSVSGLGPAGEGQLPLLGPDAVRRERLARALDRLAERFGEESIRPASLAPKPPRTTPPGPGNRGAP